MIRLCTAAVLALMLAAVPAGASILYRISDDGTGAARFQITGSYDITGGASGGASFGTSNIVAAQTLATGSDQIFISKHGIVAGSVRRVFALTSSSGLIVNTDAFGNSASGFGFSDLLLQVGTEGNGNVAQIVSFGAPLSGSLDEDVVIATFAFASLNPGVWLFGNPGIANEGIRLEIVAPASSTVPLPAGLGLLAGALAMLGLIRRRA